MLNKVLSALALAALGAQASPAPVPVIRDLNTTAFLGQWYQIATFPNPFEGFCNACTNANYALNQDGTVAVRNAGNIIIPNGIPCEIEGVAVQDPDVLGALTVAFFGPPGDTPNYLIVKLGPIVRDVYTYALVTNQDRSALYMLNRFPLMDAEVYDSIVDYMREDGNYDLSNLERTPQAGCNYNLQE